MFCNSHRKPIVIFKGNDTDFEGNMRIYLRIESDVELDVSQIVFNFLGVEKTYPADYFNKNLIVSFTREESRKFPLGLAFGSLSVIDTNNCVRTLDNRIPIYITNNACVAYNGCDEMYTIKIGTINADIVTPDEYAKLGQAADARDTYLALKKLSDMIASGGGGGGGVAQLIINVNCDDLKRWRDTNLLTPGMKYRIVDFVTKEQGEVIADGLIVTLSSVEHQFDLIVTALSSNKLDDECSVVAHDGETYFANSNLSKWKVWFNIDSKGITEQSNGAIYRMIDEYGNDCPYDFKNIKYDNKFTFSYGTIPTEASDGSLIGKYQKNSIISDTLREPKFNLCVFEYTKEDSEGYNYVVSNNTVEAKCSRVTIDGTCQNNRIGYSSREVYLYNCALVKIKEDCDGINIRNSTAISVGVGCNTFYFDLCFNIKLADSCSYMFFNDVKRSSFGFGSNHIRLNSGRQITVMNFCQFITFGESEEVLYPTRNATIDNGVYDITFTGRPTENDVIQNFIVQSGVIQQTIRGTATNKLFALPFTTVRPSGSYTTSVPQN